MNKRLRKAVVFALSAGLALTSLAGCSKKEKFDTEATALTVNGDTVSVGVVNFAIRYEQAMYEGLYSSFGASDPYNQDMFGTGSTLGEMAKEQVVTSLSHAVLAEQKMEEYGVSVTDEDKERITLAATQFMEANEEEALSALGATQEIVERYLELTMIQSKVETEMAADVDTEVSDEEAAQRRVQTVFFAPVTEDETEASAEDEAETDTEAVSEAETAAPAEGEAESEVETAALTENETVKTQAAAETEEETVPETDAEETEDSSDAETESEKASEEETETETEDAATVAAKEKAYAQAEALIEKLKAGEDFEAAAEEAGKTASSLTFGADYSVTELVDATEGLEDGTLVEEPVETSNGYYVVKLVSQLDREATDKEKEDIVDQRKRDRISELYEEWEEAGEVSHDDDVLATIVFDYSLTQYVEPETEAGSEADETEAAETEAAETEAAETEAQETETETETEAQETEAAAQEAESETEA